MLIFELEFCYMRLNFTQSIIENDICRYSKDLDRTVNE